MYGVNTVPAVPATLTIDEKVIEDSIVEVLKIIDAHLSYWKGTSSQTTVDALLATERAMLSLRNALYQPSNRVPLVIAALYKQSFQDLVKSIRSPRGKENDIRGTEFRERVMSDRNTFKLNLRKIVQATRDLCKPQTDQLLVDQISNSADVVQ